MAATWLLFWGAVTVFFEDVHEKAPTARQARSSGIELQSLQPQAQERSVDLYPPQLSRPTSFFQDIDEGEEFVLGPSQWGVIITMCWFAMTCFFILGSWEANIPVFAASQESSLGYSPFKSGNLIAIGGATTFPLLLANIFVGKRVQDRMTLAAGSFIGMVGLITFEALLVKSTKGITFATLLVSWMFVALGFNLSTTCTLSLLSKKLPGEWNARISTVIQCSNYMVRRIPRPLLWLTVHYPGPCDRCDLGGIRRGSWDEKLCWVANRFRGDRECLVLHSLEGPEGEDRVAGIPYLPYRYLYPRTFNSRVSGLGRREPRLLFYLKLPKRPQGLERCVRKKRDEDLSMMAVFAFLTSPSMFTRVAGWTFFPIFCLRHRCKVSASS